MKVMDYFNPCVCIALSQVVLVVGLDVDGSNVGALRGFISVLLATFLQLIAGAKMLETFIRHKLEEDEGGES